MFSGEPCRTELHKRYQYVGEVNRGNPTFDSTHEKETLANLQSLAETTENAASLAGEHGAITSLEATQLPAIHTPKRSFKATVSFFWDRRSNSVEPLCALAEGVAI